MKTWMTLLTGLCLLLAAPLAWSEPAEKASDSRGRYEGVAASANAVWVIDTRSGRVRKCTQEFADQKPTCSAYSD